MLAIPLISQKPLNLVAALDKSVAIAPDRVRSISHLDF